MNIKINKLHEMALRTALKDCTSSFATVLEIGRSVAMCQINVQLLMTEMFKTINHLVLSCGRNFPTKKCRL